MRGLIDARAIEVKDLSNDEKPYEGNYALCFNGRVLQSGFRTETDAWLYLLRHSVAPEEVLSEEADSPGIGPSHIN